MSDSDKNADATNFEEPKHPTPNARSRVEKKALELEKPFAQRFSVGDVVQVSGGRGVGPTIYTIESMNDGNVTLRVQGGSDVLTSKESRLKRVG